MGSQRRQFLRWSLGGSLSALALGRRASSLLAGPSSGDSWLDAIAPQEHRAFLDVGYFAPDGTAFRRTRQLITSMVEHAGATDRSLGIAFGAHSSGLGYLMTSAAWDDLGLANLIAEMNLREADIRALKAGKKNWGTIGAEAIAELRPRGVRFLACNATVARWSGKIAAKQGGSATAAADKIIAGMHPGVERVPAMILAAVQAQTRSVPYVSVG